MQGIIQVGQTSSEDIGLFSLGDKKEQQDRKSCKLGSSDVMLAERSTWSFGKRIENISTVAQLYLEKLVKWEAYCKTPEWGDKHMEFNVDSSL